MATKVYAPASKKQELFLNSSATITIAGGAAGSGKALRHGEKVLLHSGFADIADVRVGDVVVTPKNTFERVEGVYPQGVVDIYRVTFEDGSTIDTCAEHLWKWKKSVSGRYFVSSTAEILAWMESNKEEGKDDLPLIDLIKPVEYGYKYDLEIDPYLLGVLLANNLDVDISLACLSNPDDYSVEDIKSGLKNLGLSTEDKFIPDVYATATIANRFKLVQGFMDVLGYVDSFKVEVCTTSRTLKNDLITVLRSLGYSVHCFCIQGIGFEYILTIEGGSQDKLFSTRKVKVAKQPYVGNTIVSITPVGKDYATCISISGDEKLFITSNFIPTHNTYTSLLIALKFMQHPRATGVIFRRNSKMLTAPGSIWHEAVAMYSDIYPKGLKIRHRDLEIVFPNGALLKFSHMQHDSNMYDHKGGQYSLVIWDEATDFSQEAVVYLLSRMRNAYVDYRPQMFMMTNPDYNSFIRTWIEGYYLDSEGIPIEDRAGHLRYFYRQGDAMIWGNSEQELRDMYGQDAPITSLTFIGANCDDNPPLLQADPTYKSRLLSLPEVEVKRLYYGSWFARPLASGNFKREWCPTVNEPNYNAKRRVRAYDVAGSLPSPALPDPDWTRGVLMSKDDSNLYTVEDMVSLRDRFHNVEELILNTAMSDPIGTTVVLPCDPNAQAGAWARGMQRKLGELGINCRLVRPVKSKFLRFAPVSTIAQAGFLQICNAEWYQDFVTELENFDPTNRKLHDDIVDSVSDCVYILNNTQALPSFSLPTDLNFGSSPFGLQDTNFQSGLTVSL